MARRNLLVRERKCAGCRSPSMREPPSLASCGFKQDSILGKAKTSVSSVISCCLCRRAIGHLAADTWPTMPRSPPSSQRFCTSMLLAPAWCCGGWYLSEAPLLCAASSVRAWTEHSERCWLISDAVLLGVSDDQCKFPGRWRVTASHQEYIRTATRVVGQVQRQVVQAAAADNFLAETPGRSRRHLNQRAA